MFYDDNDDEDGDKRGPRLNVGRIGCVAIIGVPNTKSRALVRVSPFFIERESRAS